MSIIIDEDASLLVYDFDEAKRIGEVLVKHYPGHLWAVTVANGMATILNHALSGKWGFYLKLKDIDNDYKKVVQAGGEILERYKISRGRAKDDEMLNLKRDFAQRVIGDLT